MYIYIYRASVFCLVSGGNPTLQNALARVWQLQILVSAINVNSSLDSGKQLDPHPFHFEAHFHFDLDI